VISYRLFILAALTMAYGGCGTVSQDPPSPEISGIASSDEVKAFLLRAEELYQGGHYAEALVVCVDMAQTYPNASGLEELRRRIVQAHLEERWEEAFEREELAKNKMALEALEAGDVPDTYKLPRYVDKEILPGFLDEDSPMAVALDTPVDIHLKNADLPLIIDYLAKDTNINIIADQDIGVGKTVNIEADDLPLREVLDYISRNMGVEFHVGENMLWVTTPGEGKKVPLHTRIYKFQKGLQWHGDDWGTPTNKLAGVGDLRAISGKAAVLSTNRTHVVELIEMFTDPVEGSRVHLDHATHTLFVRNTWENLRTIDEILEALDVNPPQVFIEARFVETTVADLREIGLEWILDSPWVTSTKTVLQDGQPTALTRTQIDEGDVVNFRPFATDGAGQTDLGPQGPFGQLRDGIPRTANQGLNLTYQGIITEPMFTAVLHALDISGKGKTLSVPRMTTLNNSPAKFRNGEDLRYYEEFESQAFSLLDENRRAFTVTVLIPEGKPALEELGITLVAVPSVGADRESINLLLTPTLSRLEGFLSYQDVADTNAVNEIQQVVVKLPIISRREIQTKVVVRSGDTVVMGGLIDTIKQETIHKVPYLAEIPILGKLFQRLDVTEETRNLLVFVTATVLSESGESLVPLAAVTPPQTARAGP
jgi:type IV pilus assembly protein PilQ